MTKLKQQDYGLMDIPLSCSIFLERALGKYIRINKTTKNFLHDWNCALLDILKSSHYSIHIGALGRKIIKAAEKGDYVVTKYVESARTAPMHALHYALRFSDSVDFFDKKVASNCNIKFVDLGCGFSPLAPLIQYKYNLDDAYCIDDKPEIIDVYSHVAERVAGRAPHSISWDTAKTMATNNQLNTVVAIGVLPYMKLSEQISRLKFINANFPNFFLEIKYNNGSDNIGEYAFDLATLQKLRMSVENTRTLESTLLHNSLHYLRNFIGAMPNKREFLAGERSLFLSR